MLLNVTRHPYSFAGDNPNGGVGRAEGTEKLWHEGLLAYCGSEKRRQQAEEGMQELGRRCGIEINYNVKTNWQPVDSQRVMLWARGFGKAEKYMSALARRHFEEQTSASHRATILAAAEEAGLDVKAAESFLNTEELKTEVWRSYGSTIHEKGIHAIPYFVFNSPLTDGGPFRSGKGKPIVINGSGDEDLFLEVFEKLLQDVERKGCL